jgi:hypothetical protein
VPVLLIAGSAEKRALLLVVTVKVSACPLSSAGPALMPVAQLAIVCAPALSADVWSAPFVKLGASFTAVTVIVNVCVALASMPPLAVPPLSLSCTVMVAVPLALAAGV